MEKLWIGHLAKVVSKVRKAWLIIYGRWAVTLATDPPSLRRRNGPMERQKPKHMAPTPPQELPELLSTAADRL